MSDKASRDGIDFEEFKQIVAENLDLDEHQVRAEASFVDDLRVDSIRLVDLFLSLEEKGIDIPLEEAWDIHTVGEAFEVYKRQFD
jgi:acyl carrier protein